MDECMEMKMDLEVQDMSTITGERDPEHVMRILYSNALRRLTRLMDPHLDAVKEAAVDCIEMSLHKGQEYGKLCNIQSARSVRDLFSLMSIKVKWDSICFLQQAVDAMPAMSRGQKVADHVLSHYRLHLETHKKATLMKDVLAKKKNSESEDEGKAAKLLVPVEITSSKSYPEFTCSDCHHLHVRILSEAYSIPEEKIICFTAEECKSTTVTFLVPGQYVHVIMQRSSQIRTVWIMLELTVTEVTIPGVFTFIPSVQCFLTLLKGGKAFDADLLRVTEVRALWTMVILCCCNTVNSCEDM